MLRSMTTVSGYSIRATDGELGNLDEFFFEDDRWVVRWLVVSTGRWLGRRVLISPLAVRGIDAGQQQVSLGLSRDQIRDSPAADWSAPISEQYEDQYFGYFGYPPYWIGPGAWGSAPSPAAWGATPPQASASAAAPTAAAVSAGHRNLRSSRDAIGCHILADDGEIGHVDDFIVDDESWEVRYARIDTSNWIGGKAVLVGVKWLGQVNWLERKLRVHATREQVYHSPEYDPRLLDRDYEERLHRHYGLTGYWEEGGPPRA